MEKTTSLTRTVNSCKIEIPGSCGLVYAAGSDGPEESKRLLAQDGRTWRPL
jgi:glucose-6-phosphate 1-dehydrogenase